MSRRWISLLTLLTLLLSTLALPDAGQPRVLASDTPDPATVTLVGSLQSELGCAGDWDPSCAATQLTYDPADRVWQATFAVPAGDWEFKVALNGSWDENYGAGAVRGGANIALNPGSASSVKFYYDHETHWIVDNVNTRIVTAPGSYQSEIGCPGDWQPDCLRSWLQDIDGDGTFSKTFTGIPAGSYEFKATINEDWGENYGAGGNAGGANLPFTVNSPTDRVTFQFTNNGNVPSVTVTSSGPSPDNNVEWNGVRHDSRDPLYRTPGGAVPAGDPVAIRLRTLHNDVTAVTLRLYDVNANGQRFVPMVPAATDVSCYEAGLEELTCDFWEAQLTEAQPNNLWYRFLVTDGSDTDYYGDNTGALDGGLGAMSDEAVDNSFALMFYDPAFTSPQWAQNAVIYQIFPDRFRNGNKANDPKTGDQRYDDPVIALPWNALPEGYCRNYADGSTNCPWRFDDTPPADSLTKEQPRGRDYYGGDLRGVIQRLDYLKQMGVTAIYFNPIFDANSNHRYDTADYYRIDPALGTLADFRQLVQAANQRGIRIILDSVFNHMSSDSRFFDRYNQYVTQGACEDQNSTYRNWFNFRDVAVGTGTCVDSQGRAKSATYVGWFGFDSIPEINKSLAVVQDYFLFDQNSVSRYWLNRGADGWRLDVMGDASFPSSYWRDFRSIVKDTDHDAVIIGELWQKDTTLLRNMRGETADTTMNYRLRDAVLGLLVPTSSFDSKGFADSGRQIEPSEFAARVLSIREDYPDAAYYSLMNLLGSHDTERILWTLTPGAETLADKQNPANLAAGKRNLQIASLIQYTMPGAPTVYYGDEVGVTGDDDPDDRRTYPWTDTGGSPDNQLLRHYRELAKTRHHYTALIDGELKVLLADDTNDTLAYVRTKGNDAALVVINRSNQPRTIEIPVAGVIPNWTALFPTYCVGNNQLTEWVHPKNGKLVVTLNPTSAALYTSYLADLTPPAAPQNLRVLNTGNGTVDLAWDTVAGAAGYNLYRSPLSGGGFVKLNETLLSGASFNDTGLKNARDYFYVVTALDTKGNESAQSNQVSGMPSLTIGWANLQWPPSLNHTISTVNRTGNVYGQVWIDGVTSAAGPAPTLMAQLGYGPEGSNPNGANWIWVDATFNTNAGNNDEFQASLLPDTVGTYDYVYRYSTTGGRQWLYADQNGPIPSGNLPANPGKLTVNASSDTTPPAVPTGLNIVSASPAGIQLSWDAIVGDPTLYGYEVLRSSTAGGPYTLLATVTGAGYDDTSVSQDATYYYVVRALDESFNRSGNSAEVSATAQARTVTLVFNVALPNGTPAGQTVYIAGFLDRLDGNLPQWNPGGVALTQVNTNLWTITFTGREGTQIEYKYALGSWDFVEKGVACDEIANRPLTLSYGATGIQTVNDTVPNWRNVSPCGN